ncbi:YgaP family membrane protein [Flavobacterium sp. W22_SRS_FP1]|uniref:YgaP family membrane protein n=1 Tax=Flavobacterium sp. W22_SRS_FP1 TaxID=3240276 RepID=UPI003F8DDC27
MKKNMGLIDKIIRSLIAAFIAILYFTNLISGTVALVLGAFAIIFIITSFVSFCPLYTPFGINTRKSKQ